VERLADGAALHQLEGVLYRRNQEALGKAHREDTSGLCNGLGDLRQLLGRGDPGLVNQHILAVAHGRDGNLGAVCGNGGADDDVNLDRLLTRHLGTLSIKDAASVVAEETGLPRRRVYARAIALSRIEDG
jgi:hypothetical protein